MRFLVIGNGEIKSPRLKELVEISDDLRSSPLIEKLFDLWQIQEWTAEEQDMGNKRWAAELYMESNEDADHLMEDEESVHSYVDVELGE